ncbi:MAG: hypothetical protein IJM30_10675 [Thermoguttaceae bacterium]|nr:hypothetical protein [Thermoguttaceae bacterium]
MKRRDFLKTALGGALGAGFAATTGFNPLAFADPVAKPRWYKGNIHCHSQWSDGQDLPEAVVDGYKKNGYDFLSLTDHNILHKEDLRFTGFGMNYTPSDLKQFDGETSFWKKIQPSYAWPNLIQDHVAKARELFGEDSVTLKETADGTYCRMKTEKELREQFAEEGKFLLIPGFEMTANLVHVNLINVDKDFFMEDPSITNLVAKLFDYAKDFYGDPESEPYLFTVNHPLWQYYNIQPSDLFQRPGIRYLEIGNNDTSWAYIPEAWTPEQLWDIVNAYRAKNDQPTLYGDGTDDSHGVFRQDYKAYHSWTGVYADALETEEIIKAMKRGRSYVSTALEFAEISFDGKTLGVKINPKVEGEYKIEFVGTKKDYDETFKVVETGGDAANTPKRTVECWSKEIGKVLETADGTEASYTLKSDDLYVRAKAYRVGAGMSYHGTASNKPTLLSADAAWTQPYRPGEKF